jgi:hypothetical protein
MPTTTDLIGLAIDKNPIDFTDALNQIMMQKAVERLDDYKVDLAKSLYGAPEDDESDDSDFDDVEDSDDIDVDLDNYDDLDLDDIDLEDLTDGDDD